MKFSGALSVEFRLNSSVLNIETDCLSGWLRVLKIDDELDITSIRLELI